MQKGFWYRKSIIFQGVFFRKTSHWKLCLRFGTAKVNTPVKNTEPALWEEQDGERRSRTGKGMANGSRSREKMLH